MKQTLFAAASLVVSAFVSGVHAAEKLIVSYTHPWQFIHPMGTNPALIPDIEGNPHPDFDYTWWLAVQDFVADYDGPTFGDESHGFPNSASTMDGGYQSGPFGYGTVDNWTGNNGATTPLLIPLDSPSSPILEMGLLAGFQSPINGNRKSAYFRTTFDLPQGLINPVIRCMVDDGAVIFLDGVQVVRMNINTLSLNEAGLPVYGSTALVDPASPNQTENTLYTINLNQAGLQPSSGTLQSEVLNTVTSLAPGIHTLAVCVVNASASNADLLMALQMTADDGGINAVVSNIVRDAKGTPQDPSDDKFGFSVTVTQTSGAPGTWQSDNTQRLTGSYGTSYPFTGFSVNGPASIHFVDAGDPSVTVVLTVPPPLPPLWIGQANLPGLTGPVLCTSSTAPAWEQVGAETAVQKNGGGVTPHLLESVAVPIPAAGAVFSAILEIEDTTSFGNFEVNDSVEAYLVLNNAVSTGLAMNLLPAAFDRNGDHVLRGFSGVNYNSNILSDELNPAGVPSELSYVEGILLSAVLPPGTTSAQLVVRAVNDNISEIYRIKFVRFAPAGTIPDLDKDGVSDADELAAGTNPLSASSRFSFTNTRTASNIVVTFPTVPNRVYRIVSSTNMVNWVTENTSSIIGDGSSFTYNVSTAGSRKYLCVQCGRGLNPWP